MKTMTHENSNTTIVRSAVATSESVFLMPHLARMAVSPANTAESTAINSHIISFTYSNADLLSSDISYFGNISFGRFIHCCIPNDAFAITKNYTIKWEWVTLRHDIILRTEEDLLSGKF